MFCPKCGQQIHDEAAVCVHCGCAVKGSAPVPPQNPYNGGYNNGYNNGYNPNGYNPNGYNPNGYNPNGYYGPATDPNDAPSTGFAVLSFFFPLIGLILYLVWKNTSPKKAQSCGKGALIGFIVNIVISVIYGVVVGAAIGSMSYYYY